MLQVNNNSIIYDLQVQLSKLKNDIFTGSLSIEREDGLIWKLYFRLGRISWQAGGINALPRWQRYLKYFCSNLEEEELAKFLNITEPKQQYQVLALLQEKRIISREKTVVLINSNILEFFLDIIIDSYNDHKSVSYKTVADETCGKIIHLVEPLQVLVEAQKNGQQWAKANLKGYYPSYYPVVKQPQDLIPDGKLPMNPKILSLIDGTVSLRGLAWQTKQDVINITKYLVPFVEQKAIAFYPVPTPKKKTLTGLDEPKINKSNTSNNGKKPLIICVDDSPLVCKNLEKIITKGGYRFLAIQDSLKAVPFLLKNKPDFVFLDLIMPVTNGYELCSQLKKIPTFQNIPIVILTGKDGLVDRMRAKMVGSTDFLGKPVTEEMVLKMIDKHISVKN